MARDEALNSVSKIHLLKFLVFLLAILTQGVQDESFSHPSVAEVVSAIVFQVIRLMGKNQRLFK